MSQYIPTIGVRGLFALLPPFDTELLTQTAYTCVAVRRIADILAVGGDPYVDYYEPKELTEDAYKADVLAGVCIVSLQADEQTMVYVPSSYIQGFPDIGGIPYQSLVLAIRLGAVPDKLDLSYIKTKIAADVLEAVGIVAEVQTVAVSHSLLLSVNDASTIEAARQSRISIVKTDHAKYLESEALLASARQQIQELEAYIRAHPPV